MDRPGVCAVYTRQSVRTESDLTSCQVQRELCADFAIGKGFQVVEKQFDDEAIPARASIARRFRNFSTMSDAAKSKQLRSSGSIGYPGGCRSAPAS